MKTIKTIIKKLEDKLGSKQAVADKLEISLRQEYYYRTGEKKAPDHMKYAILWLLTK